MTLGQGTTEGGVRKPPAVPPTSPAAARGRRPAAGAVPHLPRPGRARGQPARQPHERVRHQPVVPVQRLRHRSPTTPPKLTRSAQPRSTPSGRAADPDPDGGHHHLVAVHPGDHQRRRRAATAPPPVPPGDRPPGQRVLRRPAADPVDPPATASAARSRRPSCRRCSCASGRTCCWPSCSDAGRMRVSHSAVLPAARRTFGTPENGHVGERRCRGPVTAAATAAAAPTRRSAGHHQQPLDRQVVPRSATAGRRRTAPGAAATKSSSGHGPLLQRARGGSARISWSISCGSWPRS